MDSSVVILLELLLVFGLIFVFGWRELRGLRRLREARERRERDRTETPDDF